MAKDHGSSVKSDKQYEGLRKKGMSKERAARIHAMVLFFKQGQIGHGLSEADLVFCRSVDDRLRARDHA